MPKTNSHGYIAAKPKGFTLVELLAVIVILAVLGSMGSGYIVSLIESHQSSQARIDLFSRSRLSLNIITRKLENALPNSVRVSMGGRCLEYIPVAGAGLLDVAVADTFNQAADQDRLHLLAYSVDRGEANYVVAGGVRQNEIYSGAALAALAETIATSAGTGEVALANEESFSRPAGSRRLFFVSNPEAICLYEDGLYYYQAYGGPSAAEFTANALGAVIDPSVDSTAGGFTLLNGAENPSAQLSINIVFQAGQHSLLGTDTVLIRNVP